MPRITKYKPEEDIKNFVAQTAIDKLNTLRKSKYTPKGGYRQGWGFSFKKYPDLDIITVNTRVRVYDESLNSGRLMVNDLSNTNYYTDKRILKIKKALDNYENEGIRYKFELLVCNGNCLWFKWNLENTY